MPNKELTTTDWTPARQTLDKVKLHGKLFLLGQVLLGWQLQDLKKSLGFDKRGGDRKSKSQSGTLIGTWDEHLKSELGISKTTGHRFEQLYLAAKTKLKRLGTHTRALQLLDQAPADLDQEDLNTLEAMVQKITDGETQKDLLAELQLIKAPQGSGVQGGKKTRNLPPPEEPTMEQLAFVLFGTAQSSILNLRDHSDFQKGLAALPLTSDDEETPSLSSLELSTRALLSDIEKAKKKAESNLKKALTS